MQNINYLFRNCKSLTSESIPIWEINYNTSALGVFEGCHFEINEENDYRRKNRFLYNLKKRLEKLHSIFVRFVDVFCCIILVFLLYYLIKYILLPFEKLNNLFHIEKMKEYVDNPVEYYD